eukprot:gene1659-1848_t
MADKGNYCLAIMKIKENYDEICLGLEDLIHEIRGLNEINVYGGTLKVVYYLGGDWKFLACVCGIGAANSEYACIWCTCSKKSVEKTKCKQKKQGSLEEALADLDDIPSFGISRQSQKIKVYQQSKDCFTGQLLDLQGIWFYQGSAVASSSSTYDLPDYQVEPNSIDDDFMESEREYSPEFLTMLDEIEKDICI